MILPFSLRVLRFQLLELVLLAFDLSSQSLDAVLDFLSQPSSFNNKLLPLFGGIAQALLSDLVQSSPFLANLLALVRTLHTANMFKLFAPVTAELIVADTVVHAGERNICRQVALVLAVETRQRKCGVDGVPHGVGRRLRRDGRQVCTSRSSRLV
jgi:hypothetical protein